MSTLSPTIHNAFGYYFQDFQQRVEALADDLSDEEFWTNPFPYGNSIGNLVLYITATSTITLAHSWRRRSMCAIVSTNSMSTTLHPKRKRCTN